ncbi:MAG: allantoicase [Nocardioidaceae bacterium]
MSESPALPAFTTLPDLASRQLAGSVIAANDELFAERENLIKPEPSVFAVHEFGHKGKVYDGWETRRRREDGHDWAVVRLGVPGVVHGVVVDTAWFTGNYPPFVSVEAAKVPGYPTVDEIDPSDWVTIVKRSPCYGDTANAYAVEDHQLWTHVRLSIYPDGGVSRFRVHGVVVPDPQFLHGTIDLAALENGAALVDCSNAFYSSPQNLILPGRAQIMGHGWENARRRDDGNDFAVFRLAGEGSARHVEVDTSYFVGNAPGWVKLSACRAEGDEAIADAEWWDLVEKTRSLPDTRHRFVVEGDRPATHVRLDVYPDGGLARLRVWGDLTDGGLAAISSRWPS